MAQYRWIGYAMIHMPGNVSSELFRFTNTAEARTQFSKFRDDTGFDWEDGASMTLYAYSDDAWSLAEEFRNVGCPFDCPDKMMTTGPRGGIVTVEE